jgi:hypothetical protein
MHQYDSKLNRNGQSTKQELERRASGGGLRRLSTDLV